MDAFSEARYPVPLISPIFNMKQLNIGFIGVGGIAQIHFNRLTEMEGVKISAVCDTFADRAKEVGDKFDAPSYSDYKKMIAEQQLDGCYVCIIPGVHGTTELDLVEAGIPFFLEKPVHLELDACQKVLDALEKKPLINAVGYHWRYGAGVQAAHNFMKDKTASYLEGHWYGGFVGAPWWRQMELSGGQLVEQTTHIVDMARFVAGEVKTVYAAGSTGAMTDKENYDIHDVSIATMKFESGAVGNIVSGCIAEKHGADEMGLTVKGRNFHVTARENSASWESENDTGEVNTPPRHKYLHNSGDDAFIEALQTGNQDVILSDYRSGVQTLAITLAANESMENGKEIEVRRFV